MIQVRRLVQRVQRETISQICAKYFCVKLEHSGDGQKKSRTFHQEMPHNRPPAKGSRQRIIFLTSP